MVSNDRSLGGAAWQSVGDDTDGQAAWAVTMPGGLLNSFGVEPSRIAGDDEALDLANSFTNVEDAGIAKPFSHEIVGCIPAQPQ